MASPLPSIKENHVFRRLYAKGKSAVSPLVAVYIRPNRTGSSRLGISVGTKVGKAVRRNKLRRRIRACLQIHQDKLTPGYDIVVAARVKCAHVPYRAMEKSLLDQFRRLGLLQ